MADVITRFKLETTQYDSKLRDAAKGLSEFARQASFAGNEFGKFTQKNVDAARAFGNIATSATNSKDKLKELVGAFNDVARQYNALTKDQQQSDFGKALAESMTTLKGRIADVKEEMNSTGGVLSQLKEKFTINIDAIKLFEVGLSAAKAALDVAKDALFSNEETLDDWGRTVESAEGLYTGFLDALNTGDISGYLQRIDQIVKAAQDAYNALDALNTFNAFNQINVEKTRTGMTEAIADYRGGKGSKDSVKAAGEAYKKELSERKKLERQAYIEAVGKVAAERGVSKQDLLTALSGTYGSYQSLKAIPMSGRETRYTPGGMFGGSTAYEVEVPASRQERLGAALRRLNDTELQSLQALGAQAERTGNEIASVDKQLTRVLNGRQGGGGGGNHITRSSLNIGFNSDKAALAATVGADTMPSVASILGNDGLRQMLGLAPQQNFDLGRDISTKWKLNKKGQLTDKTDKQERTSEEMLQGTQTMVGSLQSIVSGIDQLGIEIPQDLKNVLGALQVITGIVGSIQTIITVGQFLGIFNRGGVVHAAGGYSIPGNHYSGDMVPALVNSGELILNKAQQGNLASQLSGGGLQNLHLTASVAGEDIILSVNNTLKRRGKGEIATWR